MKRATSTTIGALLVVAAAGTIAASTGFQRASEPRPAATWAERVAVIDDAAAAGDVRRAMYEWHDVYGLALRTRQWRALAAVGDLALRIDAATGKPGAFVREARQAYLAALLRARAERNVHGARRIADAFEKLGDADSAEYARRIAADLS